MWEIYPFLPFWAIGWNRTIQEPYPRDPTRSRKTRPHTAAGNFYINDKPTGAVVGQQPFGGALASGTNDKAGSILNLLRWISPRSIKETFVPAVSHGYPFMEDEKP